MPAYNDHETEDPAYFVIYDQASADQLKTCYTLKGDLFIRGHNATSPIIVDGPTRIEGKLKMSLYSGAENPLFTSVSMKTLTTIAGKIEIGLQPPRSVPPGMDYTQWREKNPKQKFSMLDFPELKTAGWFDVWSLKSVEILNLPELEEVRLFWIRAAPDLHTINAPKLQTVVNMVLSALPSLRQAPSFTSGLSGHVPSIKILGTKWTDLSFPNIEVLSALVVVANENLVTLSLPSLILVTEHATFGRGTIDVGPNNHPNLVLSLPKLLTVTGSVRISGLREISIPELSRIGGSIIRWSAGPSEFAWAISLFVGVGDNQGVPGCLNCSLTHLTSFYAPNLMSVDGIIGFDSSPKLRNISFPVLRSAKAIRMSYTAALELKDGISVPKFEQVGNVQIFGNKSRCDVFENLYCRGGVVGNYSCGIAFELWKPLQENWEPKGSLSLDRTWPSLPPSCAEKGVLDDSAEHLHWSSESNMVSTNCFQTNVIWSCVRSYTSSWRLAILIGFLIIASPIILYFMKRWSRTARRRWQITHDKRAEIKVATD